MYSWLEKRALTILLLVFALAGCAHLPFPRAQHNPLARWVPSKNYEPRRAILIVIHATQQDSVEASLDTLRSRNAGGRVSSHYLVGKAGDVYQLVEDGQRAWHAGGGSWGTIGDLNSASIGIELDNDGHSGFTAAQIDALLVLLADLCDRLEIPRTQVIGHADLAPWRKTDPGPRFPWSRLAAAGFGRWTDPKRILPPRPERFDGWIALQLLGYPMREPMAALRAFRLHYRAIDDATTPMSPEDESLLYALTEEAWRVGPPAAPKH